MSLRSPWISISKIWIKFDSLAHFKLGARRNIFFWFDSWCLEISFQEKFPRLFRVAKFPKGSIYDHWDLITNSWNLTFRRQLKDEEILEFQQLLFHLENSRVNNNIDSRVWSLEASGRYSVKLLAKYLNSSIPIDKELYQGIWKSKSPKRVDVLIWILLHGSLNCSATLQYELVYSHLYALCV